MKKRILSLVWLLAFAILSLASCSGGGGTDKLTVVTTVFPCYDLARAICGERAEVKMLLSPESESHTYEPSMADIALISEADVFLYTQGEEWVRELESALSESDVSFYCLFGEHEWTSIGQMRLAGGALSDVLSGLDPDGEEDYRANAQSYEYVLYGLKWLDIQFSGLMLDATQAEVIIADRFPFEPLFDEYGIPYISALEGCGVGQEPSASVIAEIITKIENEGIEYIFVIEQSDGKTAKLISEATGCKVLTLHSCHNVSAEELERGVSYLDLMKQNVENLRLALGCPEIPSEMDTEEVK